jgi:hypothetical protein
MANREENSFASCHSACRSQAGQKVLHVLKTKTIPANSHSTPTSWKLNYRDSATTSTDHRKKTLEFKRVKINKANGHGDHVKAKSGSDQCRAMEVTMTHLFLARMGGQSTQKS